MRLQVFHAGDGDCMILETADARLLVDGGRSGTFTDHTSPTLAELSETGATLDAVLVSHLDADHITGVLRLLDDVIARRRHLFRTANPATGPYQPPAIDKIWHNGFEEQLGARSSEIADLLVTTSTMLAASTNRALRDRAAFHRNHALSNKQSAQLSLRAVGVLDVDINPETDGAAIVVEQAPLLELGAAATVHVLAPFEEDLTKLRDDFVDWLEQNGPVLEALAREMREDASEITSEIDRLVVPLTAAAAKLGDRGSVTVPNLASIMLMIDEGGRTCLLSGDGHSDDIIRGLEHHDLIAPDDGGLHVDIMKVPHHGSEFNIDMKKVGNSLRSKFLQRVTATHYVICADGANENPDRAVIKAILDSRLGPASVRSTSPTARDRFKLWFTTHPDREEGDRHDHLQGIRRYVSRRRRDRFEHEWLEGDSFLIDPSTPL